MNILITGGAGFIGSSLAAWHLNKGDTVWCLDTFATGKKDNLPHHERLRFTQADICTWVGLDEAIRWADGIYHLAAVVGQMVVIRHPVSVLQTNIDSTSRLLHSMLINNKHCRLVFASSSEVYGKEGAGRCQEDAPIAFPSGKCIQVNYSLSKFVGEAAALSYVAEHGLDCVIMRLFNTTGPNQTGRYGMVVPRFIQAALTNAPLIVYGDGSQSRSFCDIRDALTLMDILMHAPQAKGEIFNVGNDREISILELAELIIQRTQSHSKIEFIPYEKAYGMHFEDIPRRRPDLTKVRSLFSFEPKYCLEDTIDWMALTNS